MCLLAARDSSLTPPSRSQEVRLKYPTSNEAEQQNKFSHGIEQNSNDTRKHTSEPDREANEKSNEKTYQRFELGNEEYCAQNFKEALLGLLKGTQFNLASQAYGIYGALNYVYTIVFNQITVSAFPGKEKEIAYMGFVFVCQVC